MHCYVLWKEVQDRLIEYEAECGRCADFGQALLLLRQEGRVHCADSLPRVDFSAWDPDDLDAFHALTGELPVDIGFLESDTDYANPPDTFRETMNGLPIKIACGQRKTLHRHKNFEFLYVLKGSGGVHTANATVHCGEGDLCLIAPEFPHDVYAEGDSEVISLAFWRSSMENILQKLLGKENILSEFFHNSLNRGGAGYVMLRLPPEAEIKGLIRNIFQEGYSDAAYAREICAGYIELLFSYALRACAAQPETHAPRGKRMGVPMAAVLKYIQDHYRTVSLGEVAAAFHYEPDYLSRQIKVYMGRSYVELVLQLKIEAAKQLLQDTKLTIEQIAEQTGFGSAVHLSRTFRKKLGMSPSEFRDR